jgi:3-methyl-2-oxobutanoate hydroxymethyltransferase
MSPRTILRLAELKRAATPIVMVTAYDYPSARTAVSAGVDVLLVGDSGAQVVLGQDTTTDVTLDEMLMLARAVRRGAEDTLIVCDVPFGSTEVSDAQAVATAVRFVKEARADAIKIEGGGPERLSRIRAIVAAGIPVVGHLGLTPQTAGALGGLRAQGRTVDSAQRLVREAFAVEAAGAVALVIEATPTEVVNTLLPELTIPVIGIGAGPADGQVLVMHDILGVTPGKMPKFVKQYASLADEAIAGVTAYANDVRSGTFPAAEHQYGAPAEAVDAARDAVRTARAD